MSTNKSSFLIREASIDDLPALVDIHVSSWNDTYAAYAPKPTRQLRELQWRKAFAERSDQWFCYLVEMQEGEIAGFASGHDFYDPALPYKGQLDKIHFRKHCQRQGLGRKLVGRVARHFLGHKIDSMILFADPQNPNIQFYDVLGGERLRDKEGNFEGAFGWKDLSALADRCQAG